MMGDYDDLRHLSVSIEDGIAVVTLGAVDELEVERSFFNDLRDVLRPLARDHSVKSVVFAGEGDTFSPKIPESSMSVFVSSPLDVIAGRLLTVQQFAAELLTFRKPSVAAVNGPARNIGSLVALLCDAAIAVETATFGDSHVKAGTAAGDGGTVVWPVAVGMPLAREILLHGRTLSAADALALNLVTSIVPPQELHVTAVRFAKQLSELPTLAFTATKLALNNAFRLNALLTWDLAAAYEAAALASRGNQ